MLVDMYVFDKRGIDLKIVKIQIKQVGEVRVPGTKIIDTHLASQLYHLAYKVGYDLIVLDLFCLKQF